MSKVHFHAFNGPYFKMVVLNTTPMELQVFCLIITYLPRAFPSVLRISLDLNVSKSTAERSLRCLKKKKILKCIYTKGKSNTYEVNPALMHFKRKQTPVMGDGSKGPTPVMGDGQTPVMGDVLSKINISKSEINFESNKEQLKNILSTLSSKGVLDT